MIKKLFLSLLLLLGLCTTANAGEARTILPYTGSVIVASGGTWYTDISGSMVTYRNDAANATSVLVVDVTPPSSVAGSGVVASRFKVHYKVAVVALDAAPTATIRRLYFNGNTNTGAALTDAESGCGTTVNTSYTCTITLASPYRMKSGDRLQLELTVDNAATSVFQLTAIEALTQGH